MNYLKCQCCSISLNQEKLKNDGTSEIDIPQDIIEIEKLDVRIPMDVWVSMGEPFVPLDGKFNVVVAQF